MRRRISLLAAFVFASVGCAAPELAKDAPPAIAPLPAVELSTLAGARERLDRVLGGRVAVISLWATWCEACVQELAAFERLNERAGARGALVVAIAVGEKREQVASYVKWRGLKVTQLVDEDFHFADALGQRRVPTTLVVDGAGRIRYTGGALDEPALSALRSALAAPVALR